MIRMNRTSNVLEIRRPHGLRKAKTAELGRDFKGIARWTVV